MARVKNILHITQTPVALAPARFVQLLNKYTDCNAKLIQARDLFIGNPFCKPVINNVPAIQQAFEESDILHFHNSPIFDKRKVMGIRLQQYFDSPRKKVVLHYHGSPQRECPRRFQRDVNLLLSTPEMCPLFPNGKFFPNLIDETDTIYKQRETGDTDKIRVCHHWSYHTNKKDTGFFTQAQSRFIGNGYRLDLIEQLPIGLALARRAKYDAVFDHLQGYYGLISIEAMAQGITVINGVDGSTMQHLLQFFGHKPPFVITDRARFNTTIKQLNRNRIETIGEQGKLFIREVWSGKRNIQRLLQYYNELR